MTELEAAYIRVFEYTREMILDEIKACAAGWRQGAPSQDAAKAIIARIRRMPTPVPGNATEAGTMRRAA